MNKNYSREELDAIRKIFLHDELKNDVSHYMMKIFHNTRFEDFNAISKLYCNSSRERMNFLLKDLDLSKDDIDRFYKFVNSDSYVVVYNAIREIKNNDKHLNCIINLGVEYKNIYSYEMISFMLDVGTIKYGKSLSDYDNILLNLVEEKHAIRLRRFKFFEFITYCEETIKEIFGEFYLGSDFYSDILVETGILFFTVDFKITLNDFITNNDLLKKALFHHSLSVTYFQNLCDNMNKFLEKTNRGENNYYINKYVVERIDFIKKLKNCEVCLEGSVGMLFQIYGFNIYIITRISELVKEYLEYVSLKKKKKNTRRREVYKFKKKNNIYVEPDELDDTTEDIDDTTEELSGTTEELSGTTEEELDDIVEEEYNHVVIHNKNTNHLIFNRYVYIECVCKIQYSEKRILRSCLNMYYDTNEKYQNFIRNNQIEKINIVKVLHKGFTDENHFNVVFISLVNPKLNLSVFHVYLDYDCDGNMYLTTMTVIYNPFD